VSQALSDPPLHPLRTGCPRLYQILLSTLSGLGVSGSIRSSSPPSQVWVSQALSNPPLYHLRAGCLRLYQILLSTLSGLGVSGPAHSWSLLPGDIERICVCTMYSHYWCPPGLASWPSPLLSIHQVYTPSHSALSYPLMVSSNIVTLL
jgi:hypothetical protein